MTKIILTVFLSMCFIPFVFAQEGGTVGTPIDGDNPIIGLDCPLTHTWNIDSQRCDIMWNSINVVQIIILLIASIGIITILVIIYLKIKHKVNINKN